PEAPDNDTQDLSSLAAGSYVVTVTDAVGTTATATATITQPGSSISLSSVVTKVSTLGGNNGAIDLSVSGGTAGYTYLWSNGASSQDISSLIAGNYSVTVSDSNGCQTNLSVTVETNTNINIVNKQLYLSESLGLDRINPAAPPLDNTTSVTPTLSTGASGVVLENTSTTTATSGSTVTLSHTVGNGENRGLVVSVSSRDRSVSSVTYGGVALVLIGSTTYASDARLYIYGLINPNIGTANVVVTMSGSVSNGVVVSASSFFGIDQTVPLGTFASATGSSSTATVNVSSVAGDYIYDAVTYRNTSNLTVGAGQTERWDLSSGTIRGAGSSELATSTSTT
nr:SprB repeat-containing protein [Saprospiraceae bacterium]